MDIQEFRKFAQEAEMNEAGTIFQANEESLAKFAKLIEQATLERAAKEFEEDDERRRGVYAGHAVSKIIRSLKQTKD